MSRDDVPDMWWGDEAPVTTDRRRRNGIGDGAGRENGLADGNGAHPLDDRFPSGDDWPLPDPGQVSGDARPAPEPEPEARSGDDWPGAGRGPVPDPGQVSGGAWPAPEAGPGRVAGHASGDAWPAPDPGVRSGDAWPAPESDPVPDPGHRSGDAWPAPAPERRASGDDWPVADPGHVSGDAWPAPVPGTPSAEPWAEPPADGNGLAVPAGDGLGPGSFPPDATVASPAARPAPEPGPDHAGAGARRTGPEDAPPGSTGLRSAGPGSSADDPLVTPPTDPAVPRQWQVPPPDQLPPFDDDLFDRPARAPAAPAPAGPPPAPVLARGAAKPRARTRGAGEREAQVRDPSAARPPPQVDRRRLAVVYDIDGPRVRLGVAWFAAAMVAMVVGPFAAAVVLAVCAGFAGRQIAQAWGLRSWPAEVGAGIAAVPVMAALLGTQAVVVAAVLGFVVAVGVAFSPDGARLPGASGQVATIGILTAALVPAAGAACAVLVRSHSVVAAVVLIGIASAYEMADYIVGSGAGNPVEGPLAGITTASLLALPLSIVLVEPYDSAGVALLAFTAVACPFGQVLASAVLPGAGAHAPALRRIDTLLLLAPVWAAAAGAF
jgi:hypothetical protein